MRQHATETTENDNHDPYHQPASTRQMFNHTEEFIILSDLVSSTHPGTSAGTSLAVVFQSITSTGEDYC